MNVSIDIKVVIDYILRQKGVHAVASSFLDVFEQAYKHEEINSKTAAKVIKRLKKVCEVTEDL